MVQEFHQLQIQEEGQRERQKLTEWLSEIKMQCAENDFCGLSLVWNKLDQIHQDLQN